MSKKRTYEEIDERMSELPLPEQEAAWQKMKEKLDDDKDRRRIIPPIFLNCAAWTAVLLVLLAGAWLFVRPDHWWQQKNTATQNKPAQTNQNRSNTVVENKSTDNHIANSKEEHQVNSSAVTNIQSTARTTTDAPSASTNSRVRESLDPGKTKRPATVRINKSSAAKNKNAAQPATSINEKAQASMQVVAGTIAGTQTGKDNDHQTTTFDTAVAQNKITQVTTTDSSAKPEVVTTASGSEKKQEGKKKYFVSVGLGEQFQIPIAGQTTVPYSYYGREGSIADYIPSVYVRLHREQKWFVQAEFRYGAAQSVKEFSFSQQTKFDTSSMNVSTTTIRLKKTYYHQLPLTFNYMVRPNLSVGLGGMYSRFYGAVTEQETRNKNILTQSETVTKQIVPIKHFTDSFLYKTQLHFLLQADYQWRALSLGLRYTRDLQPYIRFTHPDGSIDEEKNQSLQVILRLRLWKSKKF
jgi:hypothetical protein